jgi:hypothetical protein
MSNTITVTVTVAFPSGRAYVEVGGHEVGYVAKGERGWYLAATEKGNYAYLTGLRTKAQAIEILVNSRNATTV